ncbi:MAG: hypothetical protein WBB67_07100 [bacterium]
MKVTKTIFLFILLGISTQLRGSFYYRPIGAVIGNTNLVVTAHVMSIETIENQKYACAEPLRLLYGDWNMDSTMFLPVRERPDSGIISSADYEVLYDSNTTYLLLLKNKNNHITLADYPWMTQFKLDSTNMSFVDDMQELLRIESIIDTTEKIHSYIELLKSPYIDIRESIAWKFHHFKCQEALYGLQIAVKDTAFNVVAYALSGFFQLGKKGVTSPQSVSFIESLLVYQQLTTSLYLAYAAQKGENAIPLLHNHFWTPSVDKGSVLNALTFLQDTTALRLFEELIYPKPWDTPKYSVLQLLLIPDTLAIPFPDSAVITWAMSALSDTNESIQETAIELLERKTGMDFGYARGLPKERAKQQKKIIEKWQKWHKKWLEDRKKE